jgi:hypothetical protein
MFEAENDIERALMRASAEPAARQDFVRALLDAEVFVVLIPEGGPLVPGPDGQATIPEGTQLVLATARRGEETLLPFFTAPSRARAWFDGEHIVAPDRTRDLFERYRDIAFVLNPGSDYGVEYSVEDVGRLLAGDFGDEPRTVVVDKPVEVLLAHPRERPAALIAALARELGALPAVRGAFLMLAHRAGDPEQGWMLGVEQTGDWAEVRAALGRALAGDVLQGRTLDSLPLDASSLSSTLRTGIPVVDPNR